MSDTTNLLAAKNAIKKKLRGRRLTYREIYALMDEIAHERLGDILTTYFAAAGFKEGFNPEELYFLTKAMVETGTKLSFPGIVADKHSIGGIAGTRTTMIVVPIVVAAGFTMPKTSSRAITSPAGTADVMEVLANVNFAPEQVQKIVRDVGGCIIWNGHLGIAPADDVIIQVEEPLSFESFDKIIVSIMAKKVAMSTNHLVIDMPIGQTMKIKYEKDAETVKKKFEDIATRFGIKLVVDMNHTREPAGHGVGPTLEAIDVLKVLEQDPTRPPELEVRSLRLAGKLLDLCYQTSREKKQGEEEAQRLLTNGSALAAFRRIIKAQYGDPAVSWKDLKPAPHRQTILSSQFGTIKQVNNYHLNALAKILGAPLDKKAGVVLYKKRGEPIAKREALVELHSSASSHIAEAVETLTTFPVYQIGE